MSEHDNPRLTGLRIEGAEELRESLVLSLQAVFRAYGREVAYDELAAVTGASFMITCAPAVADPAWWALHGRHAYLVPAARMYGLSLRELHPPGAAPMPQAPPEFVGHFRDSYLPFIEGALGRDEPVLAWMGWPPPHEQLWGVITGVDPASRRCIGCSCATGGERVPLEGPPVQVYLVQDYVDASPQPERVLLAAMERASAALNDMLDPSFGVVSGPVAMEKWQAALAAGRGAPGLGREPAEFHPRLARFLVSARRAAVHFLERFRPYADAAQSAIIDECVNAFVQTVACMEPASDPERVRTQLQTDEGRRELIDALTRATESERRAARAFTIR